MEHTSFARRWRHAFALVACALLLPAAAQAAAKAACTIETAELPIKMVGTRAIATVVINGTNVPLMVDSGAFYSMLTDAAAAQLKLDVGSMPRGMSVMGLSGKVETGLAVVKKLELLGGSIPDVEFIVGGAEPGAGAMGLIGRNILSVADIEYDLAHGVIRFVFPSDACGDSNMAYWAGNTPVSVIELLRDEKRSRVPPLHGIVKLNGKSELALFDSGASSMVSLSAAHRAGVKDSDMKPNGVAYGLSGKSVEAWTAPFAQVDLGGEVISNNRLQVADLEMDEDMLLGIDFFLSHRIYVSKKRRLMFFTYNGGRIFMYNAAAPAPAAASAASSAASDPDAPPDADAYARRGAASAARGDFASALADLDRACAMAPTTAAFLAQRAAIESALRQPAKARQDIDKALELDPREADARLQRAATRAREQDTDGALADLAELDKTLAPEAQARVRMGNLYMSLRMPAQAVAQFDLWVPHHEHEFRIERVLYDRCWARVELGVDLAKAFDDCDAAVDADSKSGVYLAGRAWVRLRQGNPSKARADFDRSLAARPDHALTLYGRGLARQRLGDAAAGQADLDAARKLDPKIDADMSRRGLDKVPSATH